MRRLIHVPIIHDEVDLGMAGPVLLEETMRLAGPQRWAAHVLTLNSYWDEVEAFLGALDARRLRIYEDGLPVGGPMGRRIVVEAAARGSRNYQVVQRLLDRGAHLRAAENPALLWQERDLVAAAASSTPSSATNAAGATDPQSRERLLKARDAFIARTIGATLQVDEIGVLFLGAEHDPAPRLASDIVVETLKDPRLVRAYVALLLQRGHAREQSKLAAYLVAPIGSRSAPE